MTDLTPEIDIQLANMERLIQRLKGNSPKNKPSRKTRLALERLAVEDLEPETSPEVAPASRVRDRSQPNPAPRSESAVWIGFPRPA